jgi:hypothetical protein
MRGEICYYWEISMKCRKIPGWQNQNNTGLEVEIMTAGNAIIFPVCGLEIIFQGPGIEFFRPETTKFQAILIFIRVLFAVCSMLYCRLLGGKRGEPNPSLS